MPTSESRSTCAIVLETAVPEGPGGLPPPSGGLGLILGFVADDLLDEFLGPLPWLRRRGIDIDRDAGRQQHGSAGTPRRRRIAILQSDKGRHVPGGTYPWWQAYASLGNGLDLALADGAQALDQGGPVDPRLKPTTSAGAGLSFDDNKSLNAEPSPSMAHTSSASRQEMPIRR